MTGAIMTNAHYKIKSGFWNSSRFSPSMTNSGSGPSGNGTGPIAGNVTYFQNPGVALLINISNILSHVTDTNGWSVSLVGVGADGYNLMTTNEVSLINTGTFIYYSNSVTPNVNDAFGYAVSDGHGPTNIGWVYINVNPANAFPAGQRNVALNLAATNVTANFFGVPGFRYTVERSTNLIIGLGWVPIITNVAPPGGVMPLNDSFQDLKIQVPPLPANVFYRLRYNP